MSTEFYADIQTGDGYECMDECTRKSLYDTVAYERYEREPEARGYVEMLPTQTAIPQIRIN